MERDGEVEGTEGWGGGLGVGWTTWQVPEKGLKELRMVPSNN